MVNERDGIKSILIVVEGPQSAVGHIRAIQFEDLFESDPRFSARFVARTVPYDSIRSGKWAIRGIQRWVRGPLYRAWVSRREKRIAQLASDVDIVYMLGTPSADLHHRLCDLPRPRVVMDLSDGLWLPYHRKFGWNHLETMLETADAVVCENEYVAQYASRFNSRTRVVPDSPQTEVFDAWRQRVHRQNDKCVLGWIGTADTVSSLFAIWEALEELFRRHAHLHLRLVGGAMHRLPAFERVQHSLREEYDQATMVRELLAMDIGLFPLFPVEDSRTRGTLKPRLYMAAGAVAACQDYAGCRSLIQDGVNGILAGTTAEWVERLDGLIGDADMRQRLSEAGLATVRAEYSRERCFERLAEALESVLER